MSTLPSTLLPVDSNIGQTTASNAALTAMLNNFASSGAPAGLVTSVNNAVASSGNLRAVLDSAANLYTSSSGANGLKGFLYDPNATGVSYDPSRQQIVFGNNQVGIAANPFLFNLGHEAYHAADSKQMADFDAALQSQLQTAIANGQDVSALANSYRQMHLADEGNANMAGVNALDGTLGKTSLTTSDVGLFAARWGRTEIRSVRDISRLEPGNSLRSQD